MNYGRRITCVCVCVPNGAFVTGPRGRRSMQMRSVGNYAAGHDSAQTMKNRKMKGPGSRDLCNHHETTASPA